MDSHLCNLCDERADDPVYCEADGAYYCTGCHPCPPSRPCHAYIDPADAIALRIFHEADLGSNGPWGIDGMNTTGYTEAIWTFATKEDALAAIHPFIKEYGFRTPIAIVSTEQLS